ncbi:MAG TPA: NADH-quinone oxidoreductase subunit L [Candidatus Aminicenantes bacterium]|nr:NADH-quinone oxidoreductase subunit L [Candidatus Aminicenantes bacterium]
MFALIPLFPLAGAAVNGLLGARFLSRRAVGATAVGAVGLSFAAAAASFAGLLRAAEPAAVRTLFTWVPASLVRTASGALAEVRFDMAFRYDPLAAVMTLVVTGVGLLIHVYSLGYMAQDKSYARFFAYMNLFTFAMLVLVLGANLGVMFVGWEGVGLCSYLLIGFWFRKDAAADAGKKAFITNRVGDFGFLLGTGLLVYALGTADIAGISAAVEGGLLPKGAATAAALLLFLGATGKSAQIPLYTWLPDAMEGPTPVSALIHAATMVTAGVYMVARLHVLFTFSGAALTVVALTGAVTAVYAASMGLVQNDIKRVLAYSTISQIGYMFIGLGAGAYAAGIFHLMTHAFFKGLLFLAAGSVIHALAGEQDMRRMGGLRTRVPRTYRVFLVGALAISGVPGLSGFFSKDEILAAAFASGNTLAWALGLLGAAMTAFYMFRLIFLVFFGQERFSAETARHVHESPRVMLVPLEVLAVLAVAGGYVGLPRVLGGGAWFGRFLAPSTGAHGPHLAAGTELLLMAASVAAALAAIFAAHAVYVRGRGEPARRFAGKHGTLYRVVSGKYFVDEFYGRVFVGGVLRLGRLAAWFDRRVIDGLVDGAAALARAASRLAIGFDESAVDGAVNGVGRAHLAASSGLRRLQTGRIYNYALAVVLGVVLVITVAVAVF